MFLEIVEDATGKVVHRIDVTERTERQRDRIEDGVGINLDHVKYSVRRRARVA